MSVSVQVLIGVVSTLLGAGFLGLFAWLTFRTGLNKEYREARERLKRGEALQKDKQYDLAREELQKSVEILSDRTRSMLLTEAYLRLGDIELESANFDAAVRYFILCRQTSAEIKHGIADDALLLKLGRAYTGAKKYDDAFRCFDAIQQMEGKMQDSPIAAATYSRLGEVESLRNRPDTAIDYYLRALNYQEQIADRRTQASTRLSLADLNFQVKHYQEAKNHYTEAKRLYEEFGDLPIVNLIQDKLPRADQLQT